MYKPKNGNNLLITLLITVNVLLVVQEIFLNRVLCHKPDGGHDVELACFNFRCFCPHVEHSHTDHPDSQALIRTAPPKTNSSDSLTSYHETCRDEALYSEWLQRLAPRDFQALHLVVCIPSAPALPSIFPVFSDLSSSDFRPLNGSPPSAFIQMRC